MGEVRKNNQGVGGHISGGQMIVGSGKIEGAKGDRVNIIQKIYRKKYERSNDRYD